MTTESREVAGGSITCAVHGGEAAVSRCLACAVLLCRDCTVSVRGLAYCAAHADAARAAARPSHQPVAWTPADLADVWTRALGYGVDAVLLAVLSAAVGAYALMVFPWSVIGWYSPIAGLAFALLLGIYCTLLVGSRGQTLGHSLFGLRVVRSDGSAVSYRQAFLRWVGYLACALTAFLGFAPALWNPRRQGLHDRLADTVVLGSPVPTVTKVWASLLLGTVIGLGVWFLAWLLR